LLRMRMSCDDAFLVDHVTRAGTKIDELMTLLGELLEEPETRVVVFSQWTRMHDLICERLDERDWGYAYLHGGVPSRERKNLIARFREPDTRIFLSTDAGGTGLNLQHASVVINLDLPWNPAVLEQRIGRVHRLGQQRNVRAVNFVAEGTIEHGMLRLLDFKKDLFAGVLDGGESDISMDKPRLQKFMEVVDAIETQTPAPAPMEETAPVEEAAPVEETVPTTQEAVPLPLQSLLEAGAALLQGLATAVATPSTPSRLSVERDEATGQASLRIPLPDADTLQRLAAAAGPLLELLKGR